jgi:voltage-gated potassium channel
MSGRRVLHEWAAEYGMHGRRWSATRQVLVFFGFVLLIASQSILFYWFEKNTNAELGSPLDTLWYIFVFLISGADAPITTSGGRFLAALFIVEGLVATSLLIATITARRLKGGARVDVRHMRGHTVICGWSPRLKRILQQFRESGVLDHRSIVLLADLPQNPLPDGKDIVFVQGDPSDDQDLLRAGIQEAAGAIIMADSQREDSDGRAILITLAIESLNPGVYTCVEIYDPSNIRHLQRSGADEIVCLNQFGEYLVLQSAVSPGLSKMFMELLSFGVGDEVFRVPVATWMLGKTFRKTMLALASEREIVTVAAERDGQIVVNPKGDYRIKDGDHLFVIAPELPAL